MHTEWKQAEVAMLDKEMSLISVYHEVIVNIVKLAVD